MVEFPMRVVQEENVLRGENAPTCIDCIVEKNCVVL